MQIQHVLRGNKSSEQTSQTPLVLMPNKRGGYFSWSPQKNESRYQGAYFAHPIQGGWDLYKVIEWLGIPNSNPQTITHEFSSVTIEHTTAKETFFAPHADALFYEAQNYTGPVELLLDCRKIYDYSNEGRSFFVYEEGETLVIEYVKHKDNTNKEKEYKVYVALQCDSAYKVHNKWIEEDYPYDKRRKSEPHTRFVNRTISFDVQGSLKLTLAYGLEKSETVERARALHADESFQKRSLKKYMEAVIKSPVKIERPLVKSALLCSMKSLDDLSVKINGHFGSYAGLWWFFDFWGRDEAITVGSYISLGWYVEAKTILMRLLRTMHADGRAPNRYPASDLGSADATGWVFFRLNQLIDLLSKKKKLHDLFSEDDIREIASKVDLSIHKQFDLYGRGGLISNAPQESWMDTIPREGMRIEIQALMLATLSFAQKIHTLLKNKQRVDFYKQKEGDMKQTVRTAFYKNGELLDGSQQSLRRPNIFLAYYVYPQLLSQAEWKNTCEKVLPSLWLEWGGVASVDTKSEHFKETYSGENNWSYHQGDSWYFVNNLTAYALHKIDAKAFHTYIDGIVRASAHEILFSGGIGHHAEVSSAKEQRSEGCPAQAWSAATFVELVCELSSSKGV